MKKTILSLCALVTLAVSCEKNFEADSTSYLSGEKAIKMVENDPEFLSSYVSGFYSWMVATLTTYDGHDDFGFLIRRGVLGCDMGNAALFLHHVLHLLGNTTTGRVRLKSTLVYFVSYQNLSQTGIHDLR